MAKLKYTVIKSKTQYKEYCSILEDLVVKETRTKGMEEEIELVTLLTEKWEEAHSKFTTADPVQLLKSLMKEKRVAAKDLVTELGVSKGLVSDILNYKKGFSKDMIRGLATYFKVAQEAFNRPYDLKNLMVPKLTLRKMASKRKRERKLL